MQIPSATTALGTTGDAITDKGLASLTDNFETFLTLLTTQLRYQDPLEPMDSTAFVQQLVQFTEVEQSIGTNKKLEQLIDLQSTNQTLAAVGFMGRTIEATGNTGPLVDGAAEFTYQLGQRAASATLIVLDANGQVAFTTAGNSALGKHSFAWDGKDLNGNQLADGAYSFAVAARDKDGEKIDVTTGTVARVTGVESAEDGMLLSLGPVLVPLAAVVSVRETPSQPPGG